MRYKTIKCEYDFKNLDKKDYETLSKNDKKELKDNEQY